MAVRTRALLITVLTYGLGLSLIFTPLDSSAQEESRKPLIFIPGMMGSKLCENTPTRRVLWGGVDSYRNIQRLTLASDSPNTDRSIIPCGIIETIGIVGPFKVHQYDSLIKSLQDLGYEQDKTLFIFDYDWRLSNDVSAARLRDFINRHIPSGKLDIVAHSMGGIVSRLYMANYGGDTRVRRFITLGTPHRGSLDVLRFADSGWNWWKDAMGGGLTAIRATFLSFPSVFEMLPSYDGCCVLRPPAGSSNEKNTFDPFSIKFWTAVSWLPEQYRSHEGTRSLKAKLDKAKLVQATLQSQIPHQVEFIPIVTGLLQTTWRTTLDAKSGTFVSWDQTHGDGTVYEASASNMRMIDARPSTTEHARIFNNDSARQVLRWALIGDVEPTSGAFVDKYRATILVNELTIQLVSIGLSVDPPVILPGEKSQITVRLVGDTNLSDIDIPITIRLENRNGGQTLKYVSESKKGDAVSSARIFTAVLTAPDSEGAYSISVSIPGLDSLEDLLLVVRSN